PLGASARVNAPLSLPPPVGSQSLTVPLVAVAVVVPVPSSSVAAAAAKVELSVTFSVPETAVLPEGSVTVNLFVLIANVVALSVTLELPIVELLVHTGIVFVVPEPETAPAPENGEHVWMPAAVIDVTAEPAVQVCVTPPLMLSDAVFALDARPVPATSNTRLPLSAVSVPATAVLPLASVTVSLFAPTAHVVPSSVKAELPTAELDVNSAMSLVVPDTLAAGVKGVQVPVPVASSAVIASPAAHGPVP